MQNATSCAETSSLPSPSPKPLPPLLPFISDLHLSLAIPLVTYWTLGLTFHAFDIYGYLQQYRIHTPKEIGKRNRVSRFECLRGVLFNQTLQTLFGIIAEWGGEGDFYVCDEYWISVWATRVARTRQLAPKLLRLLAIDFKQLPTRMTISYFTPVSTMTGCRNISAFSSWELHLAQVIYYLVVPIFQFTLAVLISDSWQYFGHRWMHSNKFMYSPSPTVSA